MKEIQFKGPANILHETLSVFRDHSNGYHNISGHHHPVTTLEALAEASAELGYDVLNAGMTSCRVLDKAVSDTSNEGPYLARMRACVDDVRTGFEVGNLASRAVDVAKTHFSLVNEERLGDLAAYMDNPAQSLGRRVELSMLGEAARALEEAFDLLNVPQSVSAYIRSEIEHIASIIEKIDKTGVQDVWERMYFVGEAIVEASNFQDDEIKEDIAEKSSLWRPLVWTVLSRTGAASFAALSIAGSIAGLDGYLTAKYDISPVDFASQYFEQRLIAGPETNEVESDG